MIMGEFKNDNRMNLSLLLIRIMLGSVFISEGIQKFLFPEALGIGRFIKIGIPYPSVMAPFVGIVEIMFGLCILVGFFPKLSTIPLLISMTVAFSTTKIPMLLDKGFWAFAHETRVDWCMILGLLSILLSGGGRWSLDRLRIKQSS